MSNSRNSVFKSPVAESVPFDNSTNGFTADDVQAAIEEVDSNIQTSASPGFSFGRASNVSAGTWLQCESVPSNKAGRFVYITTPNIEKLFVSNENVSTYTIEIYEHEGNEVNLTLLSSHTVTSAKGDSFTVDVSCTNGRQLALKLSSGSARNVVAGLELSGVS
jgi:hypothetical protein